MPRDKKTETAKLGTVSQHDIENLPVLTPQQHSFFELIIAGMGPVEAYRQAYPTSLTWTQNALWVEACRMRANPKIALWVNTVRLQGSNSAIASLEDHTQEMRSLRDEARQTGNYGAAVQAEKARGQASGLYVEKQERQITADKDLIDTLKELARHSPELAKQLADEAGIEFAQETQH